MTGFRTRKVRWEQFLLLLVAIGCFFTGNTAWWVMKDDEGHGCYTWQTKVLGVVAGIIVAVVLVFLAKWYVWR